MGAAPGRRGGVRWRLSADPADPGSSPALAPARRLPEDGPVIRPNPSLRGHPVLRRVDARRAGRLLAALATAALVAAPLVAGAAPRLTASVQGRLAQSSQVTFRTTASVPNGWQNLHLLEVTLQLHGIPLEGLEYDQENQTIGIRGALPVLVGTADVVSGTFFRFSGQDVSTVSSGDRLTLTLRATLLQDAPPGSRIGIEAVDDFGGTSRLLRRAEVPTQARSGFSWSELALAAAVALFAGGFLGNLYSSRRRPVTRTSIYSTVQRRMDEERAKRPKP